MKSNQIFLRQTPTDNYTINEVCAKLGLNKNTVKKLMSDGVLPPTNGGSKIAKADVLAYLANPPKNRAKGKKWEIKGDFATEGLKKMAKRTFQEAASNIEELIANAYDADATLVQVILDVDKNSLSIIDNGSGMDEKVLASYAVYGESQKSSGYTSPTFQRSPIGEYGMGGKLAITNIAENCRIVTKKDGQEHVFTMNRSQLDQAKYLSDIKREVTTKKCDEKLHGTSIFMTDLLYTKIDVSRLAERFSTKMPKSQNFKITLTVIEAGQIEDIEIKEPDFPYEEKFTFKDVLSIGEVNLSIYFTSEPIPTTKQGIWTKVNGRIVNEKQEWFGLQNMTSGNRYRWRLYGYGEANGLKDYVTFSKNDFVDSPEYREYYDFVHKSVEHVQKTLLRRDEDIRKEQERDLIKSVEQEINEVVHELDKIDVGDLLEKNESKEHTPRMKDAPETPYPDPEKEESELTKAVHRGKDKKKRRNQSLVEAEKLQYAGKDYTIVMVDLSGNGDLVSFIKATGVIEINERHTLYLRASKDGYLNQMIRDIAFTEIANDYSEGNSNAFNQVFNEIIRIYVKLTGGKKEQEFEV